MRLRMLFRRPFAAITVLTCLVMLSSGCSREKAPTPPQLSFGANIVGAPNESITVPISLKRLPNGVRAVEWTVDFRRVEVPEPTGRIAFGAPEGTSLSIARESDTPRVYAFRVEAPEGELLSNGQIVLLKFSTPDNILPRQIADLPRAVAIEDDGTQITLDYDNLAVAVSRISKPTTLAAFLAGIVALIYVLAQAPALQGFFRYFPPLIWMYFVPMFCTTIGITPDESSLYSPFFSRIMLPAILILLLIPSDIKGLTRLGGKALFMMLFATSGIVVGVIASFALFNGLFPDSLPQGSWKGMAGLTGSWIGGSPNMFAVIEALNTPPSIIGPLVIVDTVCAYTWLGVLIALVPHQHKIDRYHKADTRAIDEISAKLQTEHDTNARSPRIADIAFMIGVALVASQACLWAGTPVYNFFTNVLGFEALSEIMTSFAWSILLITAVGLLLSMTPVRHLDYCGASSIGYVGLYLLLTGYGAQANLRAILEVPVFFGIGVVWIAIHIAFLYAGMRILRAPVFLTATSSMANIGGTASAPVVAAAYNQSMAPVGLLMAILGSVMGTPLALFVVATTCKYIAGE